MATNKKSPGMIELELPSGSIVPGANGLSLPVASLVRNGRPLSREEQYIGNKLRTDLAVELGMAVKGDYGYRLSDSLTKRAVKCADEYIVFDRNIIDKPRENADDQADMELICRTLRQLQINSLFAIRQTTVDGIERVVAMPLDPPEDMGDDVIVEHKPGLLGMLFGGSQVTRVKR